MEKPGVAGIVVGSYYARHELVEGLGADGAMGEADHRGDVNRGLGRLGEDIRQEGVGVGLDGGHAELLAAVAVASNPAE